MAYQKISAPFVFDGEQLHENAVLVLTDDGVIENLLPASDALADVRRLDDGWLCPGFVNTHCHLELSHMKDQVEPNTGMVDFLLTVMFSRQADQSLVQYSMQTAVEQMTGNGIVAIGDICNTADSISVKAHSNLYWHNFVEATGFVPATAKQRFDQALQVAHAFKPFFPAKQISMVPHATYSVSAKLFELIQNHEQTVACMHNQESEAEEIFITKKQGDLLRLFEAIGVNIDFFEPEGGSSLQYAAHMLPTAGSVILVHNCYTKEDDIRFLEDSYHVVPERFSFCLCPNANQYIGNPLPDIEMLQHHHLNICLGTDSFASNKQLSILAEMQTLQKAFPATPLASLLKWATANGAKALGISNQFGRFAKGTKPGVLLISNTEKNGDLAHAGVERLF